MISCENERVLTRVQEAAHVWFFLDYDGTLADFADTPDDIAPDTALIALIEQLAAEPDIRVTIISGRRLAHIQALLPLDTLFRAGTYGLELLTSKGALLQRVDYEETRPLLDDLKRRWSELLAGRSGFYLEDKGWTLAIHGKDAASSDADIVFEQAREIASALLADTQDGRFRLQGGQRFLECGPKSADKKGAVEYILAGFPWVDDPLLVYLGDDDKDEVAFEAIQAHGGIAVAVGERLLSSSADCYLDSPGAVRRWLQAVIEARAHE